MGVRRRTASRYRDVSDAGNVRQLTGSNIGLMRPAFLGGWAVSNSNDRAQPFRFDGAQRSDLIAIGCGHPADLGWVVFSSGRVNRL